MKQGKTTSDIQSSAIGGPRGHGPAGGYATVKEAAEVFKVDPSTVRRWVAQGVLGAVRIGKTTLRVDLTSVRAVPVGLAA